jgi:hypothetical protein
MYICSLYVYMLVQFREVKKKLTRPKMHTSQAPSVVVVVKTYLVSRARVVVSGAKSLSYVVVRHCYYGVKSI